MSEKRKYEPPVVEELHPEDMRVQSCVAGDMWFLTDEEVERSMRAHAYDGPEAIE